MSQRKVEERDYCIKEGLAKQNYTHIHTNAPIFKYLNDFTVMISLMLVVITSLIVALTVLACNCIVLFLCHILDCLNYHVSQEEDCDLFEISLCRRNQKDER